MKGRMIWTRGTWTMLLACAGACSTKVEDAPRIAPPPPAESKPASGPPARRAPPPRRPAEVEAVAAPARPPDTLNGDPDGLKRDQLNAAIQAALPVLASCFERGEGPPTVGLEFDVAPEGKATNVRVQGASPEATRCVSDKLAALPLPSFKGKPVPVTLPLSIFRPAPSPVPAPVAAPAPAAVAPPPAPPQPSSTLGTSNLPTMPVREAPLGASGNPPTFIQP